MSGVASATNVLIQVSEASQVAEARRAAVSLGQKIALDETTSGQLAIVVTEAATNLIKHGGGGAILLSAHGRRGGSGVEMLAMDNGPGMPDLGRCSADGYSTAGSPGNGLGAIRRLSTSHDIYSAPGLGTVVMAWLRNATARVPFPTVSPQFQIGGICVPQLHEEVCGDAWIAHPRPEGIRVLLADGLGHGVGAADAALAALDLASAHVADSVGDLMGRLHDGLRATRGAAVAAAEIDLRRSLVRFAGLGNISGSVVMVDAPRRQMVSHNGTAGHQARKIQEFTYPWSAESLLILHSDGISTQWALEKYPGLAVRHPSVIAGVLFRDFARGRDDASVVVVRRNGRQEEFV